MKVKHIVTEKLDYSFRWIGILFFTVIIYLMSFAISYIFIELGVFNNYPNIRTAVITSLCVFGILSAFKDEIELFKPVLQKEIEHEVVKKK